MNSRIAREYYLRNNLNYPGHAAVPVGIHMIRGEIVRVSIMRRDLDGCIPVAPRLEIWLKLRDPFGVLFIVLAVWIIFGWVAGRVERVRAMQIGGPKGDRRGVSDPHMKLGGDRKDRIIRWRIRDGISMVRYLSVFLGGSKLGGGGGEELRL